MVVVVAERVTLVEFMMWAIAFDVVAEPCRNAEFIVVLVLFIIQYSSSCPWEQLEEVWPKNMLANTFIVPMRVTEQPKMANNRA